jgi:hypothetical protein
MRVNLNKIAEQIVPEYRHQQFVDSVVDLNLSPLYKGALKTFYPTTIKEEKRDRTLRRYIFRYNSNGTFEYITARQGQRNGGNNVALADSQINVTITDPADNFAVLKNQNFTVVNENLYTFGSNARIIKVNQRYLWQEKPPRVFVFSTLYYSDATSNPLETADKQNDVNWFQQGTNKYVIANNSRVVYYNNNTLAALNSWPIQNQNMNDTKPEMLDDAYLARCFYNVPLEAYDTVFVEVFWKRYTNKDFSNSTSPLWLGESFTLPEDKGRVYRVGKLAASNGVGEYDLVTHAQRTRIKTTRTVRGGNTVYN